MLATEFFVLGTAIVSFVTAIAGSSACLYFTSMNNTTNIAVLNDKVHALRNLIQGLLERVNGTAVVLPDPTPWIKKAQNFLVALDVSELEKKLHDQCMNGLLPNCLMQRAAQSLIGAQFAELDRLIESGQRIQRESIARGYKQSSEGEPFVATSRRETLEKIWNLVSEATEGIICIHGTVGVGKTFIAAAVHDNALKMPELFDSVIWVTVTHRADLCQVQEDIASSLKIELPKTNHASERARALKNALVGKNKFLLILDSMWEAHRLEDIGIPEPVNGRKLIITSRVRNICSKSTCRKRWEQIKPLHSDDAWELFRREVGSDILSGLEPETLISTKIAVSELDGLPLAVKMLAEILSETLAMNLDETNNSEWVSQLVSLRASPTYLGRRAKEILDHFKSMYQNLSEETKCCFLHSALFPKRHPIESKELIEHWMWEGLLGDSNDTLEKGMQKGADLLRELVNSHLLEGVAEGGRKDRVMMLSLVQSMAVDIMHNGDGHDDDDDDDDDDDEYEKRKHQVFIRSGSSLACLPREKDWPSVVEKASFIQNQLSSLVYMKRSKSYEGLSTLLLQDNPLNLDSDHKFFTSMPNLRILDLSRTEISILPNSLYQLKNLRALLLRNCPNLRQLPILSKLEQLIVLDLSGTPLTHFPEGIQYMKKLRRLDLSQSTLDFFPAGYFGKLINLEELLMITDDDEGFVWRSKELDDEQWGGAFIEELMGLDKLLVLQLNFLNSKVFDMFVNKVEMSKNVKFRFYVGNVRNGTHVAENSVTITGEHSLTLPNNTSELHMTMCTEKITMLTLKGGFRNLNVLDVSCFSNLSYLLSVETLGSLKNLCKICVRNCKEMTKIVQPDAEDNPSTISHIALNTIVLFNLPKLESLCCGQVFNFPNLRSIEVWKCDKLKLPKILPRSYGAIQVRGEQCWLENLEWDNPSNPLFQDSPQSHSNFKLAETTMPLEFASTAGEHMAMSQGEASNSSTPDIRQTSDDITGNGTSSSGDDDDVIKTTAGVSSLVSILKFVQSFGSILSRTKSSSTNPDSVQRKSA